MIVNTLVAYLSGMSGLSRSSSISSTWLMKLSIAMKFLRVSGISTVKARKAISTAPGTRMMRVSFLVSSGTTKNASAMAQMAKRTAAGQRFFLPFMKYVLYAASFLLHSSMLSPAKSIFCSILNLWKESEGARIPINTHNAPQNHHENPQKVLGIKAVAGAPNSRRVTALVR